MEAKTQRQNMPGARPQKPDALLQKERELDLTFARVFSTPEGQTVLTELERMARQPSFSTANPNEQIALGHVYKLEQLDKIRTRIARGKNPTNEVKNDE
jgi:hypothetical protein